MLNHFGVSEEDLKKVLATALEKGGDYADLYFEHTFNKNDVNFPLPAPISSIILSLKS